MIRLNMIQLLLFTPLVLIPVLLLFRKKILNRIGLLGYAITYLISTACLIAVPERYTNYFAVDPLNIVFLAIQALVFSSVAFYHIYFLKAHNYSREWDTYYTSLLLLFVLCMTGMLLATHLGLFWVLIEATTLVTAPFLFDEKSKASLEAAWKYLFICSIGISFAFVGLTLLFLGAQQINSLFFQDLVASADKINPFWLLMSFVFILVGFGTKAGLSPLHSWLPDAHSEAPSPISAMLSGTLLNAAMLGIFRVFRIMEQARLDHYPRILLITMGFLSVTICAIYTLKTCSFKRMLAYSSVEHIGIIALAVGIGKAAALAAIIHLVGHSLSKTVLFLTSGNIYDRFHTKQIDEVHGILESDPISGWIWFLGFLSIAAFPPFPLFFSEFLILKALFIGGHWLLAMILFLLLTIVMYGMGNAFLGMGFGKGMIPPARIHIFSLLPQIVLLLLLLLTSLLPGGLFALLERAGNFI
ncbi:MAG: proton-conducting transporter membrane subunit [Candidatus Wallbacteria bacterium]|nr:proton-conducting transporter membrane subunit [Candidatus Wallbacteria bacterium]